MSCLSGVRVGWRGMRALRPFSRRLCGSAVRTTLAQEHGGKVAYDLSANVS